MRRTTVRDYDEEGRCVRETVTEEGDAPAEKAASSIPYTQNPSLWQCRTCGQWVWGTSYHACFTVPGWPVYWCSSPDYTPSSGNQLTSRS